MKIDRFEMLSFGLFSNKQLDFTTIPNGLHVVYGNNEAGKSTSLRALISLLYGFEHIVQDDWLHPANTLAVSGDIRLDNGDTLSFTRHKRRKNDLIDNATGQPFDQSLLDRFLAGKTKDDFKNAYGISHEALRQGVESVLASGGELGQTLFTATSGLTALKNVMAKLEQERTALFLPRGQKAAINAGISQLKELRKNMRQESASHHQWKTKKKTLDQLQAQGRQVAQRLAELGRHIGEYTRYRDALKYVTQLDAVEQALDRLAQVPELPDEFAHQRIQAQAALKEGQQALAHLQAELDAINAQLEETTFDQTVIASRQLIETLTGQIALHAKEVRDSRNLRAKIHQTHRDVDAELKRLDPNLDVTAASASRLAAPVKAKLRKLAEQHRKLEQSAETAVKELIRLDPKQARFQQGLQQLGELLDTRGLSACLERTADQGNLELRSSEVQSEIDMLQARINNELAALGMWQGPLEDFQRLPLPTEAGMRRFAESLAATDHTIADTQKDRARLEQQIRQLQQQLADQTRDRQLPMPEQLQAQRELRDHGWRNIRAVWLEGQAPDPAFVARFPGTQHLADAYEKSVKTTDELSDTLWTNAADVAKAQTLRHAIEQAEKEHEIMEAQARGHQEERNRLLEQWQQLWAPAGITARSPAEMIEWTKRAGQINDTARTYHEKVSKKQQIQSVMERINADLKAEFAKLGVSAQDTSGHVALMDLARQTIRSNEEKLKQHDDLKVRLQNLAEQKASIEQDLKTIEHQQQQWQQKWSAAVAPLQLPGQTSPDEVLDHIEALETIFRKLDDAAATQQRIDAMDRNLAVFKDKVKETIARLASDIDADPPEKAAAELGVLLNEHLQRQQTHQHLKTAAHKTQSSIAAETEKMAGVQETLRRLCDEAHVPDPDQLPDIEQAARQKSNVLKEAAAVKERLAELAAGRSLQDFVAKVRQQDPDSLGAELEAAETEKKQLDQNRDELNQQIGSTHKELSRFDEQSQAAALAVSAEGVFAKLQTDVAHYTRLQVAAAVLAKAIEHYRKSNESPLLEAAGKYFKILTNGAYTQLKADFNDKGDPVLKAVRASSDTGLTIDALSDGTRDQMFLALRLGGLARHLENTGRLPFIVDDVLVHFDNDRSAAALTALADLAEKTQIIFFTHHDHLVEQAARVVPETVLCVHRLEGKS